MRRNFFFFLVMLLARSSFSQQILPLYEGHIPNSRPAENLEKQTLDKEGRIIISNISVPTVTVFLPPKENNTGAAVIICPGGGYWVNARGLMEKLLSKGASAELWERYSNEKRVTPQTPPTFLIQATNDELPVRNSLLFYEALLKNKVPVEMHLYQGGGHGFGLNNKS